MKSLPKMSRTRRRLLAGSVLASAAMLAFAVPVMAQEAAGEAETTEVVVVGARKNLQSAQQIKRNADTVVDSITAEDIGSFPDKSVAEALQRVAGITVTRFAGSDDTSHFSAEPSGVIVRGLPQVRSEFNGRDTFSANSSRGLSWGDISPELMGRIDVYKNQTAELIEGGIAGSIDLRTRVPFDSKGRLIAISADYSYGDIAQEATPAISGIYSDRWDTELGEFGFMANLAYSQVKTSSQGVQYDRMGIFADVYGDGVNYLPSGIYMRDNLYDRRRRGISLAGQWRSNDRNMLLTAQYNRSSYDNSWREYAVYSSAYSIYGAGTDSLVTDPTLVQPGTGRPDFTFDSNGLLTSGWWSAPTGYVGDDVAGGQRIAVNDAGQPFYNLCYSWEGCNERRAPQVDTAANRLKNLQYTEDFGVAFQWNPTDKLKLNLDVQYVNSEVHNYNASVTMRTYADTFVDLTGEYPTLQFEDTAENINLSPGGLTNPSNYHHYSITDHTEDSDGQQFSVRADVEYDFDGTWLDSFKFGVRYAERDQTVRWGAYNWANISNTWTQGASYFNVNSPAYPDGGYETYTFDNDFFDGNQMNKNEFIFFNMDKLSDRESFADALGFPSIQVGEYYPVCSNAGYRAGEVYEGRFGCYTQNEILDFEEQTRAVYAMLKFGGPDARIGGIGVSGNIGVRVVNTRDMAAGSLTMPEAFADSFYEDLNPDLNIFEKGPLKCERPPNLPPSLGCVITPEEEAFNNGAFYLGTSEAKHNHVLPSFNLKLDLNEQWVMRFAASRAMSRPDIGLLRNYMTVTKNLPNLANASDPNIIVDANDTIIGYDWSESYRAQAGNPYLKPMTADQFDITLEHYFAAVGSFTATVFYKEFKDYIQHGQYNMEVTNNGVTRNVLVTGPMNGDGALIKGVELAYQRFFDFLPAPWDGLGIQANYTYVKDHGIPNANLTAETGGSTTGGGTTAAESPIDAEGLEGVSPRSYNLVMMYEKSKLSARLAYNWREKFIVTSIDCCVGYPVIQESAGFLDGSIRYRVTDKVEVSVEGSNLLGTDTVLQQKINNSETLFPTYNVSQYAPNAWFKNDRRVQVGLRLKF